jgi:hypothetical protein
MRQRLIASRQVALTATAFLLFLYTPVLEGDWAGLPAWYIATFGVSASFVVFVWLIGRATVDRDRNASADAGGDSS